MKAKILSRLITPMINVGVPTLSALTLPRFISKPDEQSLHFIHARKLIRETIPFKSNYRSLCFLLRLSRTKTISDLQNLLVEYHELLKQRLSSTEAQYWVIQLDKLMQRAARDDQQLAPSSNLRVQTLI